jgi:hypothetical protein
MDAPTLVPTSGTKAEQPRGPERRSRHGPPISPPLDDGIIEPAPAHVQTHSRAATIAAGLFPRLHAAGQGGLSHRVACASGTADQLQVAYDPHRAVGDRLRIQRPVADRGCFETRRGRPTVSSRAGSYRRQTLHCGQDSCSAPCISSHSASFALAVRALLRAA